MFTKTFKQLSKSHSDIAGGKGASLGEMTNAGIPVPPGFVVLSEAFEKFLEETDLNVEIVAILGTVETQKMHTVENASENIQALILEAKIPADIEKEIEQEFQKLDAQFVAVRSSATAEDGSEAAWAGQLDSYLNTTEDSLLKNVQKCWASLFTPRAIFYRFEKRLHKQKISVAVVVQKMIQSEKSGIAFSVHPVTQDYNQIIIEAGLGLGEAIVSGSITPDSYVVEKEPRKILDINVAAQSKGLSGKIDGGDEWRDIPEPQASSQVLDEKEILELSELILKIENHYGFPCDIEWAQENGKFYITQSRPITTLASKLEKKSNDFSEKQEYRQIMNRAMSLMGCELWDISERIELPKICEETIYFDPLFYHQSGKGVSIFFNFSDPKQNISDLIEYFNKNKDELSELKKIFDENCNEIREIRKSLDMEKIQKLFLLLTRIWPVITVSNILGDDSRENVSGVEAELVDEFIRIRKESDDVIHPSEMAMLEFIRRSIPNEYKKFVNYLSFDELKSAALPKIGELELRRDGYVFHEGQLYTNKGLREYALENNFSMTTHADRANMNGAKNEIKGQSAFAGTYRGVVRIVFEADDMKKVKEGDVMVTPMTTPDLISAMKRAAAFVTDEGGITCHAAIVARELKKPCIIGTKIATQVLHDGDLVEVDADNGVVRILKKEGGN